MFTLLVRLFSWQNLQINLLGRLGNKWCTQNRESTQILFNEARVIKSKKNFKNIKGDRMVYSKFLPY